MTVSPLTPTDLARIRADFPILARKLHGQPLAYLDSASTSQKPQQMLDAMTSFYSTSNANVHRGVYTLGVESTDAFEAARDAVAALLNAPSRREVIFTRNTTEALNLVAKTYGVQNCGPGDVIVSTVLEHHANLVPWQVLAEQTGATLRFLDIDDEGNLQLDALDAIAREGNVKLVAVTHQSNTLGVRPPVAELVAWAHALGAVVVLDAAQTVPNRPVDVQALDVDFLAFSGHKTLGPTGIGALWGRESLLADLQPFLTGGEMIRSVKLERTSWNSLPWKFEAGTPAFAEAVGLHAAIDYLHAVGLEAIDAHEHAITDYALGRLTEVPGLRIIGPQTAAARGGVVSFVLDDVHPHDVAEILDRHAVCVRAGHHCTQPLIERLGLAATVRASFYLTTTEAEIDRLVDGLLDVRRVMGV
ncbi:MAG: cysteine desulfurase [Thermoleophilia bacterium]|nr:cysteine desulfurase [Thermoleophilia bacterium]MBJ7333333.1 cysteine desulfurase [Thermoleophilia bacterium]